MGVKVEGRRNLAESHPEAKAMALHFGCNTLACLSGPSARRSQRAGIVTPPGEGKKRPGAQPYSASAIASMLG
jgi:hypothetical protein